MDCVETKQPDLGFMKPPGDRVNVCIRLSGSGVCLGRRVDRLPKR